MSTRRYPYIALLALLISATTAFAQPDPAAAKEKEQKAIAAIKSGNKPDMAIACKQLAVWGSKDAVPTIAPLLEDKELTSWARIALEAIPGPEADQALRDALSKTQGRTLVGVINSLGVRKDAQATQPLIAMLK